MLDFNHEHYLVVAQGLVRTTGKRPTFRFDVITKTKTPAVRHFYTTRLPDDYNRLERLIQAVWTGRRQASPAIAQLTTTTTSCLRDGHPLVGANAGKGAFYSNTINPGRRLQ